MPNYNYTIDVMTQDGKNKLIRRKNCKEDAIILLINNTKMKKFIFINNDLKRKASQRQGTYLAHT